MKRKGWDDVDNRTFFREKSIQHVTLFTKIFFFKLSYDDFFLFQLRLPCRRHHILKKSLKWFIHAMFWNLPRYLICECFLNFLKNFVSSCGTRNLKMKFLFSFKYTQKNALIFFRIGLPLDLNLSIENIFNISLNLFFYGKLFLSVFTHDLTT